MKFGVTIFPTERTPDPATLARMAEERGFESLFFPEHTHIPASRETPYPMGEELPPEYAEGYDPFVALAAAATATTELKIGTASCLVNQRDPIITAKAVATLDRVSGGRFLFGVGAGWNIEEMRNHGADAGHRFRLMRERIEAMKEIWAHHEASYSGRYVSFERIWSRPKPLQKPHPPIMIGGNGERVLDRVVAYGDEWMPNRFGGDEAMLARIDALAIRARAAGRPTIPVTLANAALYPESIGRYECEGVHRCVYWLPAANGAELEAALDRVSAAKQAYERS
jgi:probable F420-dependent oxidoreductase